MDKMRAVVCWLRPVWCWLWIAGGCSEDRVTASSVRSDPSPELQSIAMSHGQRENEHARVIDTNLRQVWDDLDMILLLDNPSQGSRYPVP